MFDLNSLDNILTECGVFAFENSITGGLDRFITSCSEAIQQKWNERSIEENQYLLYLMKFLHCNWSNHAKGPRSRTKLCLNILFIFLLAEKSRVEWKPLLKQSVNEIALNWSISQDKYPFLSDEEINTIKTRVDFISNNVNLQIIFSSLHFEKIFSNPEWHYIPKTICYEFILLFKSVYDHPELNEEPVRRLKAFFVAISEEIFVKDFLAILKILLLDYCITEIKKLMPQSFGYLKANCMVDFLTENLPNSVYLKRLFVKNNKENTADLKPIPVWAEWFFLAGQKTAMVSPHCNKSVIAFSLPTRSYAVLFFHLGYETWIAENRMLNHTEINRYFDFISECKLNEALLIWDNMRWKRCWFQGIETIAGSQCVKVDVPGAEERQHINYIPKERIAKLRKAVDPNREIAANQIGFEMSGFDSIKEYYNQKEDVILNFLTCQEKQSVVVGNLLTLKREIDQEKLFLYSKGKYFEISFQDIIRFKNFMTKFDLSRGLILSARNSDNCVVGSCHTIIYDGALAYINRKGTIQKNLEILFLDRSEPQFSNARDELMSRYYDREENITLFEKYPPSVEMVAFKE